MINQEETGRSEVDLEKYLQELERLNNALPPADSYREHLRNSGQLPVIQQEPRSTSLSNDSGLKDFADSFGYASIILLLCVMWGWAFYVKHGGLLACSDMRRKYRKLIVALTQISITMLILSGILQLPFL